MFCGSKNTLFLPHSCNPLSLNLLTSFKKYAKKLHLTGQAQTKSVLSRLDKCKKRIQICYYSFCILLYTLSIIIFIFILFFYISNFEYCIRKVNSQSLSQKEIISCHANKRIKWNYSRRSISLDNKLTVMIKFYKFILP